MGCPEGRHLLALCRIAPFWVPLEGRSAGLCDASCMQLLRLATIRLTRPPPRTFGRWPYRAANGLDVQVHTVDGIEHDLTEEAALQPTNQLTVAWPYEHEKVRIGVAVSVDAGEPLIVEGALQVPAEPRERAEAAIGEYADALAVAYQCKRVVRSPRPCVALSAASDEERAAIHDIKMLRPGHGGWASARLMPQGAPAASAASFADRLDGLALLADSLGEETAVARSRELFRLFDRAFRRGPSGCAKPLTTFLLSHPNDAELGYTRNEVSFWLEVLRAESVHADRRPTFARSPEIEPYLPRMEFAAYDVLFNKAQWRQPSAQRRPQQRFMSGVQPDGHGVVLLEAGATLLMDWIDQWGVYRIDHESSIKLPVQWIWRLPGQEDM